MSEPISYVIAVFDSGEFVSFWGTDEDSESDEEEYGQWYETRPEAVEALQEIPRKVDARIYELVASPEPSPKRTVDPGKPLPTFLQLKDE